MDSFYCYNTCYKIFDCFKQMVISLAPVSLSNIYKKELLHLPKIDFSEEKCNDKCLKEHFWASTCRFQNFLGACLRRLKLASSCSEVWLRPWTIRIKLIKIWHPRLAYFYKLKEHTKLRQNFLLFFREANCDSVFTKRSDTWITRTISFVQFAFDSPGS